MHQIPKAVALPVILAACGGHTGSHVDVAEPSLPPITVSGENNPVDDHANGQEPRIHKQLPSLPELRPQDVSSAPISYSGFDGTRLLVGKDIGPRYPLTNTAKAWGWGGRPGLFYGRRHEHTDSVQLIEYLSTASGGALSRFSAPPTVHIGQAMGYRQNVLRAVQWINEALPPAWHIQVGDDAPPLSTEVPDGSIYIDFGPAAQLGKRLPENAAGVAHSLHNDDGSRRAAHVFVAPDNVGWHDESDDIILEKVIVHELLHGLGFGAHVDRQDSRLFRSTLGRYDPTTMLFPIDRLALFAAHARLKPGDTPETIHEKLFNGWSTLADHFVLQTAFSEAGVSRQFIIRPNEEPSFLQGWASGEAPHVNLEHSPLKGSVTWDGELIGVRPEYTRDGTGESYGTVSGEAQIRVDLATLDGYALFDQLEAHPSIVPGPVGTGVAWGDGDLEYDIAVRGNTFRQTGGDDGILTGIFTGKQHEGAAGTLERRDLTAAFGATRTPEKLELIPEPVPQPEFQDEAERLLGLADSVIHAEAGPCGDDITCLAFVLGGLIETVPARDDLALSELDIDDRIGNRDYQPVESRGSVSLARSSRNGETFDFLGYGGWLEHSFFHVHLNTITTRDLTVSRTWFPDAYSVGDATGTNPAPVAGSATWGGVMVGVDISAGPRLGNAISGDAAIRIGDLTAPRVDVRFTNVRDEDADTARADMTWSDLAVKDGVFDGWRLRGQFYGPNHEEVGGVFSRDDILGAFGARRE